MKIERLERVDNRRLAWFLDRVALLTEDLDVPVVTLIAQGSKDPFRVLASTLLSARTKDETTAAASARLFALGDTPEAIARLSEKKIESLIRPVGFYRTKAKHLRAMCLELIDRFDGQVPRTIEELVELPGVGRKTANLVLVEGFQTPAICVDTHVHRITNLWGYIDTRDPTESEVALRAKLPKRWWLDINRLLVAFGQHLCKPVSPLCSQCPLKARCPRIGVERFR
jgi:endonuclease III